MGTNDAVAYFQSGEAYFKNGNYSMAIADLTQSIKLDPNNARAYCLRGLVRSKSRDTDNDKEIEDFSQAIRLNPNYVAAYGNRASAYVKMDEPEKAIDDYKKVIKLDPNNILAYTECAKVSEKLGLPEDALELYTNAIRIDPHDTDLLIYRATLYRAMGNDNDTMGKHNDAMNNYNDAIGDCTKVIQIDPAHAIAYCTRGFLYKSSGDLGAAITDFTRSLDLIGNNATGNKRYTAVLPDAYCGRGEAYYAKGEYDKAITDYSQSLRLDPNMESAKKGLAEAKKKKEGR